MTYLVPTRDDDAVEMRRRLWVGCSDGCLRSPDSEGGERRQRLCHRGIGDRCIGHRLRRIALGRSRALERLVRLKRLAERRVERGKLRLELVVRNDRAGGLYFLLALCLHQGWSRDDSCPARHYRNDQDRKSTRLNSSH